MYSDLTIKNGKVQNTPSSYQKQDQKTKDITSCVMKDFLLGEEIQSRTRPEFNNISLIQEINKNQKAFNSYIPPRSTDPDEEWRSQTVRPVTRNKLISIAAHVTVSILYPNVFAQNPNDEEDKDAAMVMRDLIEYNINNSNYSKSFLEAVITALVDPCVILQAEWLEVYREVKRKKEKGEWTKEKILDEVLSGFSANVVPCQELLIANIYEKDIQKQRFLIRKRYIDFEESKLIYGSSENFKYVTPGVKAVYSETNQTFYDVQDEYAKQYLVYETIYYNRILDLQIVFLNGVLVTDADQPNPREDKLYPFSKSGYEPLNSGKFFYYKSAANKLNSDQNVVDVLYNMVLDGTYLQLMPPMALYGTEDVNSSVIIPGQVTSFRDPNTKMENIGPRSDLRAGLEAIGMVERSLSESSQDSLLSGITSGGGGDRTAREAILLQQNAKTALGLFGKMIAFMVEDFGHLMIGDILQYMTVGQVDQITGDIAYKSFLIPDKMDGGKKVTRKIKFDSNLLGSEDYDSKTAKDKSYDVLEQEGGLDSDVRICKTNPDIFRKIKYKCTVSADELTPKSKAIEKALNLEAYDRLIQNPTVDQTSVTKEFLLDIFRPGQSDKFIKKEQPQAQAQGGMGMGGADNAMQQKGVNTSMLSQITGSNSLGSAVDEG